MNNKIMSVLVLIILVVGLSTVGAVAATDSGEIEKLGFIQAKVMPITVSNSINMVKISENPTDAGLKSIASSVNGVRNFIKNGPSDKVIPLIHLDPTKIFPKPIIIVPIEK